MKLVLFLTLFSSIHATCPYEWCIYVENRCGLDLWLDRTTLDDANNAVFNATYLAAGNNTVLDVSGWNGLPGQRLYAWWVDPVGKSLDSTTFADKVEIDICVGNSYCYNPTAVDYIALPVQIGPKDPSACPSVPQTGTIHLHRDDVKSNCPTVWDDGAPWGVCRSPGFACSYQGDFSFCDALQPTVDQCINDGICAAGTTSTNAYACSGYFAGVPEYCAGINRGVYPSVVQEDPTQFYVNPPYNEYAAWIHTDLEKEYAFPYDDYEGQDQSGYNVCETNELSVIWCPAD